MSARKALPTLLSALALVALAAPAVAAAATEEPAWNLQAFAAPTNFTPGDPDGIALYEVMLTNAGAKVSDRSTITITDTLPPGLGVEDVEVKTTRRQFLDLGPTACKVQTAAAVSTVTCELDEGAPVGKEPAKLNPLEQVLVTIHVSVPESDENIELTNQVVVEGGGAEPVLAEAHNEIDPECKTVIACAPAGFQEFFAPLVDLEGAAVNAAASHPFQFMTGFAVNLNPSTPDSELPYVAAGGDLKQIEVRLPPGLIANPSAVGRCTALQFNTLHAAEGPDGAITTNDCPDSSAVGVALIQQLEGSGKVGAQAPIYNLVPPRGMPAQLGLQPISGLPIYVDTAVKSGPQGLGVRAYARNIQQSKRITSTLFTVWGTPADPRHDPLRGQCAWLAGSCDSELATVKPFFRLPSSCENPLAIGIGLETWTEPPARAGASFDGGTPNGCGEVDFSPAIEAKPTTNVADSPSGMHFKLAMPQGAHEDFEGLSEADLREARVTLPRGLALNPSAAQGLAACSPAQIGLQSAPGARPIAFDEAPAGCPAAAKVGKVEVQTAALRPHPAGRRLPGPTAGQPLQLPPSPLHRPRRPPDRRRGQARRRGQPRSPHRPAHHHLRREPPAALRRPALHLLRRPRAALRTPPACGTYTTTTELVPWSAPEGGAARPRRLLRDRRRPGRALPDRRPGAEARRRHRNPTASTYSPFSARLTRDRRQPRIHRLNLTTPPGLTAKLAGIPYCPEAALAPPAAKAARPGRPERSLALLPGRLQVGTITAGAGAGPAPFYTTGKAYLAGPYKGAPLSLVAIIPAVAGPFDLGTIVVRTALNVDPETAQVTAVTDPIPTILQGIPLDVRDDPRQPRPARLHPQPDQLRPDVGRGRRQGHHGSAANAPLRAASRSAAAARLGFKPKLTCASTAAPSAAGTRPCAAVLTDPKGADTPTSPPPRSPCRTRSSSTRPTSARSAPGSSSPPTAARRARSTARPGDHPAARRAARRPGLPALLRQHAARPGRRPERPSSQPIESTVGRIDSVKGGIRNTFDSVPDAPVTKFVLEMQGGKKGLLVNSRNICKHAQPRHGQVQRPQRQDLTSARC